MLLKSHPYILNLLCISYSSSYVLSTGARQVYAGFFKKYFILFFHSMLANLVVLSFLCVGLHILFSIYLKLLKMGTFLVQFKGFGG